MVNIEHTLCLVSMIFALGVSNHADATFRFSDVAIPNGSVTFVSDEDMAGYVAGSGTLFDNDQFSVRSKGDIWNGVLAYSPNVSSTSAFDRATRTDSGNTGTFGTDTPYTWSQHIHSLVSATASRRMATVTFGTDYRDPYGSGTLDFLLGNGNIDFEPLLLGNAVVGTLDFLLGNGNIHFEPVLLDGAVVGPISVAESFVLLLAGIGLTGFVVRRFRRPARAHYTESDPTRLKSRPTRMLSGTRRRTD